MVEFSDAQNDRRNELIDKDIDSDCKLSGSEFRELVHLTFVFQEWKFEKRPLPIAEVKEIRRKMEGHTRD